MRVISGWLGGRIFEAPHGNKTHPMSEKMRGAIFGALGDIKGLTVLDSFAGSGALSIEAISRGAKTAMMIEVDPGAFTAITRNIKLLKIEDRVSVTRAYAGAWSTRHQIQSFDIVLLDPPYDKIPWRDLKRMPRHVKEEGVLVLSWPGSIDLPSFENMEIVQQKAYGDGRLAYYKRKH